MPVIELGSLDCADCRGTHRMGRDRATGLLVKMDPCLFPLHCMDCKKAYDTSVVRGSTGLCTGCARVRENAMRARDRLMRATSRR